MTRQCLGDAVGVEHYVAKKLPVWRASVERDWRAHADPKGSAAGRTQCEDQGRGLPSWQKKVPDCTMKLDESIQVRGWKRVRCPMIGWPYILPGATLR